MSRYRALLQEQSELKAEWDGIIKKAEDENRVDLMAEEKARVDAIKARLGQVAEGLKDEEERRAWERNVAPVGDGAPRIHSVRDRAEDKPWESMGHFLQAVAAAGTPGGRIDPRLYADLPSGMSSGAPSDGGFLVRTEFSTALLEAGVQASQLAPLCDMIPIGPDADGIEAPMIEETSRATGSRMGGVRVYRRGEADTVTASKPKLRNFDLRLEDMMALCYSTERLLQDARAMQAVMTTSFASEFAFKVDDEIVRGNGAGECLGVLASPALVTIDKEAGQAAATFVNENISAMWARLHVRSRGRAVWFYNQDVEPQLDMLAMAVGTGAMEPRFVTYGPDGVLRIKGRPAVAIEQAETLGTVGDVMLLDLFQYVLITKGGIQADESMHVRFLYNERTFRWIYRINGAPKWISALTPYKGGATKTVSPFVVLQTRA